MKLATYVFFAIFLVSCSSSEYFTHRETAVEVVKNDVENRLTWSSSTLSGAGVFIPSLTKEEVMTTPSALPQDRIIRHINEAQKRVYLEVYLLTNKEIINALVSAKHRGLDVRVILEKEVVGIVNANRLSRDTLASAGVSVVSREKDRFNFIHAKFLLADDTYVISTGNYTKSTFSKNREFFVFGKEADGVGFLESVFLADFYDTELVSKPPERFFVSPIDSRKKIEAIIQNTKKRVDIFTQTLSDPNLINLLVKKSQEGTKVRVCVRDESVADPAVIAKTALFLKNNIAFTYSKKPILHAKTIRTDTIIALGSENLTANSLDNNREIGIFFSRNQLESMYEDIVRADCKWR